MNKFFLGVTLLTIGCSDSSNNMTSRFIEKYHNERFIKFKNKSFTIRGVDNNGGIIVFVFDDENNCGFVRMVADKSICISKQEPIFQKENCTIDTPFVNYELTKDFLSYKIGFLHVDSFENVFISFQFKGAPKLLRLNDSTHISHQYKNKLKLIKDNWYKYNEQKGSLM